MLRCPPTEVTLTPADITRVVEQLALRKAATEAARLAAPPLPLGPLDPGPRARRVSDRSWDDALTHGGQVPNPRSASVSDGGGDTLDDSDVSFSVRSEDLHPLMLSPNRASSPGEDDDDSEEGLEESPPKDRFDFSGFGRRAHRPHRHPPRDRRSQQNHPSNFALDGVSDRLEHLVVASPPPPYTRLSPPHQDRVLQNPSAEDGSSAGHFGLLPPRLLPCLYPRLPDPVRNRERYMYPLGLFPSPRLYSPFEPVPSVSAPDSTTHSASHLAAPQTSMDGSRDTVEASFYFSTSPAMLDALRNTSPPLGRLEMDASYRAASPRAQSSQGPREMPRTPTSPSPMRRTPYSAGTRASSPSPTTEALSRPRSSHDSPTTPVARTTPSSLRRRTPYSVRRRRINAVQPLDMSADGNSADLFISSAARETDYGRPSLDQENRTDEDILRELAAEGVERGLVYRFGDGSGQESGVLDETPPRIGRLERRGRARE